MEGFESGSIVNIMRSDGRVHSAMVSRVHESTRSVTVEWYERGETKGKEIDFETLLELNQTMHSTQSDVSAAPSAAPIDGKKVMPKEQPTPGPVARQSSSFEEEEDIQPEQTNSTQAVIRFQNLKASMASNNVQQHNTNRATISHISSRADVQGVGPVASRNDIHRNDRLTIVHGKKETEPPIESKTQSKTNARVMQVAVQQQQQAPAQNNVALNTTVAGSIPRRSSCVVTVGLMEENRIKQRDKFKVLREKKNALMNQDGGNPNWEFANMIREYQNTLDFRPLTDGQPVENHQITVCVRKRPLSQKELARKEIDVICVPNQNTLIVHEPKTKVDLTKYLDNQKYRFDYIFDETCANEMVYNYTAKPLVQSVFEGGMATCFAYGQTGSGKTHTMGGNFTGKTQDSKSGIYALAAKDVFEYLHSPQYSHKNLAVSASFFEIYSGKVFDLLSNKRKIRVLEDGKRQVQLIGLMEKEVHSVDDVLAVISAGNSVRTSGQTAANANSSRSHAIFSLTLRARGSTKTDGKFSFIDLAGNERGADTSSEDPRTRSESSDINKSLLALKECIRALGRQSHLPFRGSTLTLVLRDSFVGENTKTCMIAMIAPGMTSCEHTLNTLRYAHRAKELVALDPSNCPEGVELSENDEHMNGGGLTNRNDLALVRALNEHEMSVEMYNHHTAISELQQKEEEVVDSHQRIHELLEKCFNESRELLNLTNTVDYDQHAYGKRGKELFTLLAENMEIIMMKNLMSEFEAKLKQEEIVSRANKSNRHQK
ncbi:kinesin-like protein KIF2A isoform X2 [Anopheles cruzii]|uniref:kinesin-like protein KIF2A isoform X2 n=1 Tax=Anopheles cruzii TaxID=68878 RepID=UPI0022EC3F15|nr:kinesin-like protein KIF2A isoform X2 [Anopheles cruzii]